MTNSVDVSTFSLQTPQIYKYSHGPLASDITEVPRIPMENFYKFHIIQQEKIREKCHIN